MIQLNFRIIKYRAVLLLLFLILFYNLSAQQIAILKYDGGGDWYSNPTALPNLIDFCNENSLSMVFTGKRHFKH